MKEELQAKQYHNAIEEEEEFDDEIEESEEEIITLDFDNGVAIQEGIVVGEGLYDKVEEILSRDLTKAAEVMDAPKPVVAKGMAFAYETPEDQPNVFSNITEYPEGYLEAAEEAELVEKVVEKVKEEIKPEKSYRDTLNDILVDTVANRAIRSLMEVHHQLETELYDTLDKKYRKKMGRAFQDHQGAMLKSLDAKQRELRKAYGYGGRVSVEYIPDWAKPFVENYIKNFVEDICDLTGDAE